MSKKRLLLSVGTLTILAGLLTFLNTFSFNPPLPSTDLPDSSISQPIDPSSSIISSPTPLSQPIITALPPTPLPSISVSSQLNPPLETNLINNTPQIISTTEPAALPIPQQPVPNQVVITFQPNTTPQERQAYIQQIGGTVSTDMTKLNSVVVSLPTNVTGQPLPQSSIIAASEPDYYAVALGGEVNDPLYDQQWALTAIAAPDGWAALPASAATVAVAVIDSGICANHPDLQGRILPGYDFVDNDPLPQDDYGHGCAVAGIIAANSNNGMGIAGIAPNAHILPVRVLNAQGIGTYSDVAAGIVYAADQGAKIINLSLGGSNASTVLEDAVNYAINKSVTVIAAAGNTGGAVLYPAAYASVIAVASVDQNLQRSSFSSYGPEIDLLAPGRDILTTSKDGGYKLMSGTSFAAPQVAGVAALDIGLSKTLTLDGKVVSISGNQNSAVPTPVTTNPVSNKNYYYYVRGQQIPLNLSTDFVAVRTDPTNTTAQTQALSSVSNYVKPLSEGMEIPKPRLTLLPLQPNISTQSVTTVIEDLRASDSFQWVNPVFKVSDGYLIGTDEFIAQFPAEQSDQEIAAFNMSHGVEILRELLDHQRRYVLKVSRAVGGDALAMANIYNDSGFVIYAEPNFVNFGNFTNAAVNDTYYPNQWYLNNEYNHDRDINAPEAWDITMGQPSVVIAVLDNGFDLNHEDLTDKFVPGWDTIDNDSNPSPGSGPFATDFHGTNVAGIAAARTNNGVGISGVCPNCSIMPIRVLATYISVTDSGTASSPAAYADGIIFAFQNHANVINMSWHTQFSTTISDALDEAANAGTVLVASAGNDDVSPVQFPANYNPVIAVGATNLCDQRKTKTDDDCNYHEDGWGSNFGGALDLSAPGVAIYTTDITGSNGYSTDNYNHDFWGTSASAPIVAGVAGLILSANPSLTPSQVEGILETTANDVNYAAYPGYDNFLGWGRVDAFQAVQLATVTQPVTVDIEDGNVNGLIEALNNPLITNINLASNGIYNLSVLNNGNENSGGANGLPPIRRNTVINGNGAIIKRDTVAPAFRIFQVVTTGSLTLNDMTIQNGSTAKDGGAIINSGSLILNNVIIDGNYTGGKGGAIHNLRALSFAADSPGVLQINNSRITQNSATYGGAIYNNQGYITITGSNLSNNATTQSGGTIYNQDRLDSSGTVSINQSCIVSNNHNDIQNDDTDLFIDATSNWWGVSNGPGGSGSGSGSAISSHVNYQPFLDAAPEGCETILLGTISGKVTAQETGLPIANVKVHAINASGPSWEQTVCSASDGNYEFTDVPQGRNIFMEAFAVDGCPNAPPDYVWKRHSGYIYLNDANPIASNIDFVMAPGGTIRGNIVNLAGDPISVWVNVYQDDNQWYSGACAQDGTYEIKGVPLNKDIQVQAGVSDCDLSGQSTYTDYLWLNITSGQRIINGVNFVLEERGSISGNVVTSLDGSPIVGALVTAGSIYTFTDAQGHYRLLDLPKNENLIVKVETQHLNYMTKYWNNVGDEASATPILLANPDPKRTNINFALDRRSISGTVHDGRTGLPVPGISVQVNTGELPQSACTDAEGNYTIDYLPKDVPLTVFVAGNSVCDGAYSYDYVPMYWQNTVNEVSATPITITTDNAAITGINFTLWDTTGAINGTVYQTDGITPIANVMVNAETISGQFWGMVGCTAPDGHYSFLNAPADTDIILYADKSIHNNMCEPDDPYYVSEYYNNAPTRDQATYVHLNLGEIRNNIDFTLDPAPPTGTISGTVYDTTGTTPLANLTVVFNTGTYGYGIYTDSEGNYQLTGVPLDTDVYVSAYMLPADSGGSSGNYAGEYWQNTSSQQSATPIHLTGANSDATGIDFTLDPAGYITGTVSNASTGLPIENISVWFENSLTVTCTSADGSYSLNGVPFDTPVKVASGPSGWCLENGYPTQWYPNTNYGNATPITVTSANSTVAGIDFLMSDVVLLPPQLLDPTDFSSTTNTRPQFTWSPAVGADHYEFLINSNISSGSGTIYIVFGTNYQPSTPLLTTTYYWWVRSVDASQNYSDWTQTRTLTVSSPPNAAPQRNLVTTHTPTLTWGRLSWAIGYGIEVDTDPNFGSPDYKNDSLDANALTATTGVLPNGTYYWRVHAKKTDGTWSGWSAVDSFILEAG